MSFESGAHTWDWDISGGTITAQVIAAGDAGALSLYIEQADGSNQDRRIPDATAQIVRLGVPAGTYRLSLKKDGKRVSDVTDITIENPGSSVEVVLRESR